ncbi:MAG: hypothetical protein ABR562_04715 [Thermoplasmatota archaeon]|nr:hypothetical protein [Halobacteriales archaeon]
MQVAMERNVKKEVRLTKDEARRLRDLAKAAGVSESEVLRAGIDLSREEMERRERRRKAWEALRQMAIDVPGETIPFRMK